MASHFISNDYLFRNRKTMNKVSVATPAAFVAPSWRAGAAYEKAQQMDRQKKTALNHAFIAIEKLDRKRSSERVPYVQRTREKKVREAA